MTANPFHLGWFLGGFRPHGWRDTFAGKSNQLSALTDFYVDFARSLERACFDYMIIEDSSFVPDVWEGKHDFYVRTGQAVPKLDPAVLASILTQVTTRLGIVPTLSVTEYPPYLLARQISTLDHVSKGRAGWNMVTSSSDRAAQNYGHDAQPEHDLRYEMAAEMTELVWQLWESWEPDSVVVDQENGIFADPAKVHAIDFEGRFFKSRGPINTARSPQGKPVIVQAGGSPAGREYAAHYADTIIASSNDIAGMKAYRDDVRSRVLNYDRKSDSIKLLFICHPILAETDEDAQAERERRLSAVVDPEARLASMGYTNNIDFSKYDLDVPIGELAEAGLMTTNGHRANLDFTVRNFSHLTLREYATSRASGGGQRIELCGSPDTVAAQMDEVMQEVGGDGFLIAQEVINRRVVSEITDGLVPALQRRGLTRTGYSYDQFRDNLLEF